MNTVWVTALQLLAGAQADIRADEAPRNPGPDFGKASPFGLLVIALLLIGTFALVWSMNRHLNKLPESFDPDHPEPDQVLDDGTVSIEAPETSADPDGPPREPGG